MRHIILLRAINLGRNNRIAMPELRNVLTDAGFAEVTTLLASGNVVASYPGDGADVARLVGELIAEHFGLSIGVVVRTTAEIAATVAANPLPQWQHEPKHLHVMFLSGPPTPAAVKRLRAIERGEEFEVVGSDVVIHYPAGVTRVVLDNKRWEKATGLVGTARNWNTVAKLAALV